MLRKDENYQKLRRKKDNICKRLERYKTIRFQENANRKIRDYKINEFLKFLKLEILKIMFLPSNKVFSDIFFLLGITSHFGSFLL